MTKMTQEQKFTLINNAKRAYKDALSIKKENGNAYALGIDLDNYLKESCHYISSLIHYIANKEYHVPDTDNKVFHCKINFGEGINRHTYSHYVNFISGEYIDASIEQFNHIIHNVVFDPHEFDLELYTDFEENDPMSLTGIQAETESYYELIVWDKYLQNKHKRNVTPGILRKFINHLSLRKR